MVGDTGIEDGFRLFAFSQEFHADLGMPAFLLVVHRLADIVQQTRPPGDRSIQSQFIGHDLAQVGDFQRMAQHILAVTGAIRETAQKGKHRLGDVRKIGFQNGRLANFEQFLIHFLAHRHDDFFNAGGRECGRQSPAFPMKCGRSPGERDRNN